MKYLGIDYGEKRIGIAASDEGGGFAFARETVPNDTQALARILEIAQKEGAGAFVLGTPRVGGAIENPVTERISAFAEELREVSGLPVFFQNEQFSSIESTRFAPNGQKDDAVSAAIILQRYLDGNQRMVNRNQ